MKIRSGFVSNSSSSSFVLAFRKDCTKGDVVAALSTEDDYYAIREAMEYYDGTEQELIEEAADFIMPGNSGLVLGDWRVTAEEFSSEDGEAWEYFLYLRLGSVDTEKFKVG